MRLRYSTVKGALLYFEVDSVLTEDVKESYYNIMMLFFSLTAENEDVVHVDGHNPLIDELFEDVIHHHLEGGGGCLLIQRT